MGICEEKCTKKFEFTKEQGYWIYFIVFWEVWKIDTSVWEDSAVSIFRRDTKGI
jgi:hypothetical protein